jgi:hypothetical protein
MAVRALVLALLSAALVAPAAQAQPRETSHGSPKKGIPSNVERSTPSPESPSTGFARTA